MAIIVPGINNRFVAFVFPGLLTCREPFTLYTISFKGTNVKKNMSSIKTQSNILYYKLSEHLSAYSRGLLKIYFKNYLPNLLTFINVCGINVL